MAEINQAKTAYGPRKIGQKAFEKQKAELTMSRRGATKYGHRKGGGIRAGDPELPQEDGNEPPESQNPFLDDRGERVTIGEVKDILEENDELLDLAIETEVASDDPRKGAVEHYIKLEHQGQNREGVVNLLNRLIEE